MIAKFDDFNRFCQPMLTLTNPEGNAFGILDEKYIKNFKFNPKFNDVSEISFDFYAHEGSVVYNNIRPKMRIEVEGYGSFIISSSSGHKSNNGDLNYKPITLKSTESELEDIQIPYIDGTLKLYDPLSPDDTLLGMIMSKIPHWSIDYVDAAIMSLYRTFEIPNTNILDFLLNTVQDAYGCLFIFDTLARKISVYSQSDYIHYTDILLTNDELIESLDIDQNAESIVTALTVYGSEDLSINSVNPLGTSTIYNFKQVRPWMSNDLREKIDAWQVLIEKSQSDIISKNQDISIVNEELTSLESELTALKTQADLYSTERDALISVNSSLNEINNLILQNNTQISAKESVIKDKQNTLQTLLDERSAIQNALNPSGYFGDSYHRFLSYVFEKEYTQNNIGITDAMDYNQRLEQAISLYNDAKEALAHSVNISDTYSINTKSFVFNKKFIKHTQSLECGHLIGVEDGESISYFPIMEFDVDYENKSVNIILGNRFNSTRPKDMFSDLVHTLSSTNKTIEYLNNKKADSDELSDFYSFISSSLNLAKNSILSADGQSVEITNSGYHGRKVNEDGKLDGEEVAIVNNTIAFTKDNWNTCSLALGKLQLDSGATTYGLIAETLVGKFILGESLKIVNSNSNYTIDDNGLCATSANGCRVTINPNDVDNLFTISNGAKKLFYVDSNGNGNFTGKITAGSISTDTVFGNLTVSKTLTKINQNSEKISLLVDDSSSSTSLTLTSRAIDAISDNINLTGKVTISALASNLSNCFTQNSDNITVIEGGHINTGSISVNSIIASELNTTILNATQGNFDSVNARIANVEGTLYATMGEITTIKSNYITTATLDTTTANITGKITAVDAEFTNKLEAVNAKFNNLNADNITSGTLSMDKIDFQANGVSWRIKSVVTSIPTETINVMLADGTTKAITTLKTVNTNEFWYLGAN